MNLAYLWSLFTNNLIFRNLLSSINSSQNSWQSNKWVAAGWLQTLGLSTYGHSVIHKASWASKDSNYLKEGFPIIQEKFQEEKHSTGVLWKIFLGHSSYSLGSLNMEKIRFLCRKMQCKLSGWNFCDLQSWKEKQHKLPAYVCLPMAMWLQASDLILLGLCFHHLQNGDSTSLHVWPWGWWAHVFHLASWSVKHHRRVRLCFYVWNDTETWSEKELGGEGRRKKAVG